MTDARAPVRPRVLADDHGEVDLDKYPEPKEATNKIRGKSDLLEVLTGQDEKDFLVVKLFYFFFFAAFGSLFPLMGVYFKQMGMDPFQCGVLVGCRPLVELVSAPFWGNHADRMKNGKKLLYLSLASWIIFTLPIGSLQPTPSHCVILNRTEPLEFTLGWPQSSQYARQLRPLSRMFSKPAPVVVPTQKPSAPGSTGRTGSDFGKLVTIEPSEDVGQSPLKVIDVSTRKWLKSYVAPLYATVVYKLDDITKSFMLMLLLIVIGEFFSAPAITLVDTNVLTLLGENADRYGYQRMFGSLGWALSMFFIGMALDGSTDFAEHPCGVPGVREKNYKICFFTFAVMMGAALVTAYFMDFRYGDNNEEELAKKMAADKAEQQKTNDEELEEEIARQLNLPSLGSRKTTPTTQAPPSGPKDTYPITAKTTMFAQTTRELPEWSTVIRHFGNVRCGSFLFVAWLMGFGIGLIFTFLFWHLQEYGGAPTLFGLASIINHISEIAAYFYSLNFIKQYGHVKVLCMGLAGNVIRFSYIAWLTYPVMVLPFELMQGFTHAVVWAACCSYIAHNMPQEMRSSAQAVLQGAHHGFGRSCGAIIGGFLVKYYGSPATFFGYGFVCAVVLAVFIFINFYHKDTGFVSDLPASEDPHQMAEDSVHLAPHGVPSNPIPRAHSSNRLQESNPVEFPRTSTGGQVKNPFLGGNDNQAEYYAPSVDTYDSNGNYDQQQPAFADFQYGTENKQIGRPW